MRHYEVFRREHRPDEGSPFYELDANAVCVEGGSIIFYDVRRDSPTAIFPAANFIVMGLG